MHLFKFILEWFSLPPIFFVALHVHFADLYFLWVLDIFKEMLAFFFFFCFNKRFDFYSSWSTRGKLKNRAQENLRRETRKDHLHRMKKTRKKMRLKWPKMWVILLVLFSNLNRVDAVSQTLTKEGIERLRPWVLPFSGPLIWLKVEESSTFVQKETKCKHAFNQRKELIPVSERYRKELPSNLLLQKWIPFILQVSSNVKL
jgi:hypothetical protein